MRKAPAKKRDTVASLKRLIVKLEKRIKELERKIDMVYDLEDNPNNDKLNKPVENTVVGGQQY